jgi:uncharacterized protein YfaQ (DUF2300 family)
MLTTLDPDTGVITNPERVHVDYVKATGGTVNVAGNTATLNGGAAGIPDFRAAFDAYGNEFLSLASVPGKGC